MVGRKSAALDKHDSDALLKLGQVQAAKGVAVDLICTFQGRNREGENGFAAPLQHAD